MVNNEFEEILNFQIDQIDSNHHQLTDQDIHSLSIICGPEILLAALEILDLKSDGLHSQQIGPKNRSSDL